MKKVYICCPYSFKTKKDHIHAYLYCRLVYDAGFFPVHPHSYLMNILEYSSNNEKRAGVKLAHKALLRCNEVWVFGIENKLMLEEIEVAEKAKKKIRYFDNRGNPL